MLNSTCITPIIFYHDLEFYPWWLEEFINYEITSQISSVCMWFKYIYFTKIGFLELLVVSIICVKIELVLLSALYKGLE